MTKRNLYLALQAIVCILLTAYLSASAIEIYREGAARRAEHPMESIYTPEIVGEKLASAAPLFFTGLGLLLAGLVLGVGDDNAEKPAKAHPEKKKAAGMASTQGAGGRAKKRAIGQVVLIAVAVILIIAGIFNGSARDVLYKAITICTECVGLG